MEGITGASEDEGNVYRKSLWEKEAVKKERQR